MDTEMISDILITNNVSLPTQINANATLLTELNKLFQVHQ